VPDFLDFDLSLQLFYMFLLGIDLTSAEIFSSFQPLYPILLLFSLVGLLSQVLLEAVDFCCDLFGLLLSLHNLFAAFVQLLANPLQL
jgi:hypothetical protein